MVSDLDQSTWTQAKEISYFDISSRATDVSEQISEGVQKALVNAQHHPHFGIHDEFTGALEIDELKLLKPRKIDLLLESVAIKKPIANTNQSPEGSLMIDGSPEVGQHLYVNDQITDPDGRSLTWQPELSYQWYRQLPEDNSRSAIPGATGSSYQISEADQHESAKLSVSLSYEDDGGRKRGLFLEFHSVN